MTDEEAQRLAELQRAAEEQLEAERRLTQSMADAAQRDGGC
ncbi:hypothetical protein ACWCWD_29075 [Streptomyces sp. NPDC001493]